VFGGHSAKGVGTGTDGKTDHHRRRNEDCRSGDEDDNKKEGVVPIHGTLHPRGVH
jgi:hypothetical protein